MKTSNESKVEIPKSDQNGGAIGASQNSHYWRLTVTKEQVENAVAIPENKTVGLIADMGGFEEMAGAGMESVTSSDVIVPRLTIAQGLSPQLSKSKPEFIKGAKIGDILDVGLGEAFPEGILFLPVMYRKEYLEWGSRESGKGLVNIHKDPSIMDQCTKDEKTNAMMLPNGNLVQQTAQIIGMNLTAGGRRSFIGMASTQLKRARLWMTMATSERLKRSDGSEYQPPLLYRSYYLTTAEESNAKGTWSVWQIARGPALPELDIGRDWKEIMKDASEFYRMLVAGEAQPDTSSLGGDIVDGVHDGEVAL